MTTVTPKGQATVALKDGTSVWFGYYQIKVMHLPRRVWRVFVVALIMGALTATSWLLGWPMPLTVIFLYLAGWNALGVVAGLALLVIRAKEE